MLVIDGAYLQLGALSLEKATNRKLSLTETSIRSLIKCLESKTQSQLNHRHFVTAEINQNGIDARKTLYTAMK